MSNKNNGVGKTGEFFASGALMQGVPDATSPTGETALFEVVMLGEKIELFDLIVFLVDHSGHLTGPYFFVQVKSTIKKPKKGAKSVPAPFSAAEVVKAQQFGAPCYLVGAAIGRGVPEMFIRGIPSGATGGFKTVSILNSLSDEKVLRKIHKDVSAYFVRRRYTFKTSI